MKIEKITVTRGKKVNLGNYETENYEISMEVELEDQDDAHDIINGLKNILDQKLLNWENTLKLVSESANNEIKTEIKTAKSLIDEAEIEEINKKQILPEISSVDSKSEKQYICPKCNEPMHKKENKEYYLCSKHWGYPDMIEKGEVREKQF